MVNELQTMRTRVVKVESAGQGDPRVTSKGGLVVVQGVARRLGLWTEARRILPGRKDPTQGFETTAVVASVVHGLLSGGHGFSATEPMRGDEPLLKMLGLKRAPSAETVEEVVKYLVLDCEGAGALNTLLHRFVSRCVDRGSQRELRSCEGFVPFWVDGSLLEVGGKNFDSIKWKESQRGQMCVGAYVGPWLTGLDFAVEGEGEESVGRRLLGEGIEEVLRPKRLMDKVLIILDSLYGDGPTLDMLDGFREKPAYIIGVQGLVEAERVMQELPEMCWRDTGANSSRGWSESSVTQAWLECKDWNRKRLIVCRRWRNEGEMIWNYAAVTTRLTKDDPRVARVMAKYKCGFEEVIWRLYSYKQAMENQWKDMLCDMGLHHPPCAKARVNSVFYAIAGLAYDLSVAVRRLTLGGASRRMRLWRLRREVFDLAGYVVHHGRNVIMRLLDARDHLIEQLLAAMERLARL